MGAQDRRKNKPIPGRARAAGDAPGDANWAEFFRSPAQAGRFENAVRADFERRGMAVSVHDGWVVPTDDPKQMRYGLSNVGQLCAQSEEAEWPEHIAQHFDRILASAEANAEIESRIGEFSFVRRRLLVRLWDEETSPARDANVVSREFAPGLLGFLCLDLPDSIRTITPDEAARWDRSEDSLFDEALDNMERDGNAKLVPLEVREGSNLLGLEGETAFLAALALRLERYPAAIGKYGTFVAMPTRDGVLMLPFSGAAVVEQLSDLMVIALNACRDGPGSVTHRVYWVREGDWIEIPYAIEDDALNVHPPDELVEVLNSAAEDSDDGPG